MTTAPLNRGTRLKRPSCNCRHSRQSRLDLALTQAATRVKVKQMMSRACALEESRMKLTNRYGVFAIALVIFAIGATLFTVGVGAQEEGWQIVRADYGFRNQRNDVTDILKDLVGRGGVNGRVVVNNQTMGGDPAVGKDKSLRIFARNRRNEEREFNFNEGAFVDVRMFDVRMMDSRHDDWDDRRPNHGDRDRDDGNDLRIIRAYYG